MKITPKIFSSLIISAFSGILFAQETDTIPAGNSLLQKILPEVVISANRYGTVRQKTPEAINVIENKTIQKFQSPTSPAALLTTPGVFVQKTNHGGGSPFLRGLTGNQTLLLVDGIRLSNAVSRYGPNQYFNTIDVFSIDKIEVLRGSGSVQYGSDAIGGTIHTISYEPVLTEESRWGGNFLTRIATQGMERSLHGDVDYSSKRVAFRAGVSWRNFGHLVGGDSTGRQRPTGYRELDYDFKCKILLSSSADVTMAFQSVYQTDIPVFHKIVLENYAVNRMDPQNRKLAYIRLKNKINAGVLKSIRFTGSLQFSEEGRELRKNGSVMLRTENDKVFSTGFSAEAYTQTGNWSANNGLEFYNDQVKSSRTDKDLSNNEVISMRGLYPNCADMTSMAAFSIHTFKLKKWNLTGGIRYNTFIINVSDETAGDAKLTPSAFVGSLGLLRNLNKASDLFISLNNGFRSPNIDDLGGLGIVDFRYETPDFNLKPEQSFQYQLGYKYHNHKLKGEIYFYRNELYNLIVRNKINGDSIEGYPMYRKENVERAFIQGIESSCKWEFNASWTLSASLTYTYGHNITRNEPVRRIPPVFGGMAIEYKVGYWWFNIDWLAAGTQNRLAAGDKDDNRIPDGGTPGWNILNVNASHTFRFITANMSVINIFNRDYRYHGSGINGYGRSAFLSLSIHI